MTPEHAFWLCAFFLLAGYCLGYLVRAGIAHGKEVDYINALRAQAEYHEQEKRALVKCMSPPFNTHPNLNAHTLGEDSFT